MSSAVSNQSLIEAMDQLLELRPFPIVVSRLIAACGDEDVTANQISQIISVDPALAVNLLKIANSPIYGHAGQISSVQHATVIIGLRALKNLAVSAAVGDVFGAGNPTTQKARQRLWQHALACGSIAQTLAAVTGAALPDEAFLSGVVHDVGKLFLADHRPVEYLEMLSNPSADSLVELETQLFGVAHTFVGGECSHAWGLSDEISDVICFHHQPDESDFGGNLVTLVSIANELTRLWDAENAAGNCSEMNDLLKRIDVELSPAEVKDFEMRAISELNIVRELHLTS